MVLFGAAGARLSGALDMPVPAGYILTWCGRLLGWAYGVGGGANRLELSVFGLSVLMALVGLAAGVCTLWRTQRLVSRLAARAGSPEPEIERIARQVGIGGRLVVSPSPGLYSFCFGLLRPRVCISTGLLAALDTEELRAVLAHERHHLVERDPLKVACANVLAAMAFPVPFVNVLRHAYLTACELDADQAAVRAAGRGALAGALRVVLTHPGTVRLDGVAAVGSIGACGARLDQLTRPGRVRRYPRIGGDVLVTSALTVGILLGLAVATPAAAQSASQSPAGREIAPLAPDLCQIVWDECDTDMATMACCLTPAFDPRWREPLAPLAAASP